MRSVVLPALTAGLFLCFASACSSSGSGGSGAGAGATTSGSAGSTGSGPGCPADLAAAPDSEFCSGDMSTIDCSQVSTADKNQVCGVAVATPVAALKRSANVKEYAGTGPADLSCYDVANYPTAGTSAMVQISGVAKIFAHGCASTNLSIEVHTVVRTSGAADGTLGPLVGKAVTTPADCTSATTGVPVPNDANCGTIYQCKYTYDNVPSETELVILTQGNGWAPLYDYNNYIPTSAVTGGVWTHNVRALASDDYGAIAAAALGGPITAGNGAIAGETHDCGDIRISGATADVNVARRQLTYFTDDESNPLPNTQATATGLLGLYAALDISPGPASVGAIGLVDGKLTTVGYFRVQVFPDAVTTVTFSGLRPFQIQK
jgi:hypothetical protein